MFAFGHGLSYTDFEYRDLVVTGGDTVCASASASSIAATAAVRTSHSCI